MYEPANMRSHHPDLYYERKLAADDYWLARTNCQHMKPHSISKPGLIQSHPIPERIWTDVTTDLVVGLP